MLKVLVSAENPKYSRSSAKEVIKKLKYLKMNRIPILTVMLNSKYFFFSLLLPASSILIPA
jgi:hypothetical protein